MSHFEKWKNNYEAKKNVWNKYEMKTIKDYHDLYLKRDVLLLADVFEKFRNNSLKNYGVCPSHYLSATALSWDAMLNMTPEGPVKILMSRTYRRTSGDSHGTNK